MPRTASAQHSPHHPARHRRAGAALVDVIVAVLVAAVGLLASVGVIQKGIESANDTRWLLLSVSATRDVVDSLAWTGTGAHGERVLAPVTVRWTPTGGRLFRFEAYAPDSAGAPRLVIHAHVPSPIP